MFTFDAAHRLDDYEGKCNGLHGHTYRLEVTLKGPRDGRGVVIDFETLKEIVGRVFLVPALDHRFLNESLPFANTTAENMVVWFFERWDKEVAPTLPGTRLERVALWETPTAGAALSRRDWEAGRHAAEGTGGAD